MEHLFGMAHDLWWGTIVFFSAIQIKNGMYTIATVIAACATPKKKGE